MIWVFLVSFVLVNVDSKNFLFCLFGSFSSLSSETGLSRGMDLVSIIFLCIVFFVTWFVRSFREFYMSLYNNKKFYFLIAGFFASILVLSVSSSFYLIILGWDGLGIVSLCLIMFYPNKITIFNSYLTIMFNRLGDILIILVLGTFLCERRRFFFISSHYTLVLTLLMLICSFTKRAQFPLSSWLPAAMSAPTPISAMVHSSTLVTAGIYIIFKIRGYTLFFSLGESLFLIRVLTFLAGGLLANLEVDFKKIVAFSTISQIRLIIFLSRVGLFYIARGHMLFHAFFKTLLFSACGVLFIFRFRAQQSKIFNLVEYNLFIFFLFFFSVFIIRGLVFSTSFFSKDLALESVFMYSNIGTFILLITGSLLTLFYCCKILRFLYRFSNSVKIKISKIRIYYNLVIFSTVTSFMGFICRKIFLFESFPLLRIYEIFLINIILFTPIFFALGMKSPIFLGLGLEVYFMKSFFTSNRSLVDKSYTLLWTDLFILKPKYFKAPLINWPSLRGSLVPFIILARTVLVVLYLYSLHWT